MEGVRQAAGFEGLIILGVIYFILNLITKAGKKKEDAASDGRLAAGSAEPEQGLSLEKILREIQRAKERAEQQQAASRPAARASIKQGAGELLRQKRLEAEARRPQPLQPLNERGPLGRHSRTRLPAAEEIEERDSLEGGSLEVEERIQNFDSRTRAAVVDQDDQAEALVQRRISQANARNAEHRSSDHRNFDKKIRDAVPDIVTVVRYAPAQMRDAFVWRELLGPPKSMEE
jgi:hypothetical protein